MSLTPYNQLGELKQLIKAELIQDHPKLRYHFFGDPNDPNPLLEIYEDITSEWIGISISETTISVETSEVNFWSTRRKSYFNLHDEEETKAMFDLIIELAAKITRPWQC